MNQRLRRSPPDVVYTPIDVTSGKATQAYLDQPFHHDLDRERNLYIAEAKTHCIRKLNLQTGIITTVAGSGQMGYGGDGGPAIHATMNEPYALQVDTNGDIYILDRLNAVVRKVDARTGTITTVVGDGTKKLSQNLNHKCIDRFLEVWPESHWPSFALRQADAFQSYTAW